MLIVLSRCMIVLSSPFISLLQESVDCRETKLFINMCLFCDFPLSLKTLLSEPTPEESRWPPELILLREKFTARSQLEIAQLQIKHEEEVLS